jgi:hypothetical protein
MSKKSYKENNNNYIKLMNQILDELPKYVKDYVYDIEGTILPKTRYAYVC